MAAILCEIGVPVKRGGKIDRKIHGRFWIRRAAPHACLGYT
jgi:hypothetical protein